MKDGISPIFDNRQEVRTVQPCCAELIEPSEECVVLVRNDLVVATLNVQSSYNVLLASSFRNIVDDKCGADLGESCIFMVVQSPLKAAQAGMARHFLEHALHLTVLRQSHLELRLRISARSVPVFIPLTSVSYQGPNKECVITIPYKFASGPSFLILSWQSPFKFRASTKSSKILSILSSLHGFVCHCFSIF